MGEFEGVGEPSGDNVADAVLLRVVDDDGD